MLQTSSELSANAGSSRSTKPESGPKYKNDSNFSRHNQMKNKQRNLHGLVKITEKRDEAEKKRQYFADLTKAAAFVNPLINLKNAGFLNRSKKLQSQEYKQEQEKQLKRLLKPTGKSTSRDHSRRLKKKLLQQWLVNLPQPNRQASAEEEVVQRSLNWLPQMLQSMLLLEVLRMISRCTNTSLILMGMLLTLIQPSKTYTCSSFFIDFGFISLIVLEVLLSFKLSRLVHDLQLACILLVDYQEANSSMETLVNRQYVPIGSQAPNKFIDEPATEALSKMTAANADEGEGEETEEEQDEDDEDNCDEDEEEGDEEEGIHQRHEFGN